MSRAFALVIALLISLLMASCAGRQALPELTPASDTDPAAQRCRTAFAEGDWQFVHAITFRMAAGGQGSVIGVVRLAENTISCALMTVEGLTLFAAEAEGEGQAEVTRAVAPFDKPEFAEGLLTDLRTIFRRPPGRFAFGRFAGGDPVCRYLSADQITDLQPRSDGCMAITTYQGGQGRRLVDPSSCRYDGETVIATDLELRVPGRVGYTLNLHLISAERLPAGK